MHRAIERIRAMYGLPPIEEVVTDPYEVMVREACSNAALMHEICQVLSSSSGSGAPRPRVAGWCDRHGCIDDCEPIRDYDPDIDGWPWEAGI